MLSATGHPSLRPRPPGQRRPSSHDRRSQTPEAEPQPSAVKDTSPQPPRSALSNVTNVPDTTSVDTVCASNFKPLAEQLKPSISPIANIAYDAFPSIKSQYLPPSDSNDELDHEWLGSLDRHELEELLIEASRKVREREQKLVVAANIGKALLEKNLTLRSGIMSSMASSTSLFGLTDIEAMINDFPESQTLGHSDETEDVDSIAGYLPVRPMNSPPTTDVDIHSQGQISPGRSDTDTTPMAHPIALPDQEPDYFSRPTASTSIQHHDTRSAEASFAESPVRDIERSMWVPKDAGLIVSQPCSPSASISSYASQNLLSPHGTTARVTSKNNPAGSRHRSRPSLLQLQALEAQRQLATLGEQNDILHQQISELQTEAESARHEGGKRLSRLNKEIRGLKAELEAATRRNDELETGGQSSRPTFPTRSTAPAAPIYSHQRTASPWSARISNRQGPAALSDARLSSTQIEGSTPDHYGLPTSTSNLEAMVRSAQSASGESALVAQLLTKIKELEETNAAMAKAEEDFGSRMGRAMQEDERLRDAFNTVGQDLGVEATTSASMTSLMAARDTSAPSTIRIPGFITPSHSLQSLDSIGSFDPPSLVSSVSPSQKRRAPGNRHVIEHRKTVRSAIRRAKKELASDIWGINSDDAPGSGDYMSRSSTEQSLGTYSIDLSGDSSAASSPQRRGLNRKVSSSSIALGAAGRPRIRITPSIEDLGRRRKMQEEVVAGPPHDGTTTADWQDVTSPTASTFHEQASLRPSDAMQAYSRQRSPSPGRHRSHQESPVTHKFEASKIPNFRLDRMPSLSPSQQKSFHPTGRVRRSRSRSSSFGSEARFGYRAPSTQQSPDPFLSSQMVWNRPRSPLTPGSTSSHRGGRTLGSELGSIFGGDDRKHDFDDDLPQRRRSAASVATSPTRPDLQPLVLLRSSANASALDLRSKIKADIQSDRPTANFGRLVPENEEEHQDDLECVLAQSVHGQMDDVLLDDSPVRPRDAALLSRVMAEEQGDWLAGQPIIESGGLQDEDEPRGAQFDLINAVVQHQAVAWADDDDYGRTISQREAIKLGLLAPSSSSLIGRGARLLTGKTKYDGSSFGPYTKSDGKKTKQTDGSKASTPFRLEIESSDQVDHRLRIESLLRRRRQEILRQRDLAQEWEQDALGQEQEEQLVATYAPTPQRMQEKRRRALASNDSKAWPTSPGDASPSRRDPRRSTQRWVQTVACVSPMATRGGHADEDDDLSMGLDCIRPEEGEFELLDCPTWKKQGGRGTDYFPTSFRARYKPGMVKQRVVHVSQVTYGWVEEWVQFAFVVFLAFVVMVEQGPNRNVRRAKPTSPALLRNKAE